MKTKFEALMAFRATSVQWLVLSATLVGMWSVHTPAVAQSMAGTGTGTASSGATGGSVDSHAIYNSDTRFSAASAIGPALTTSTDTCMGSTSIGGSGTMFGFSVGTTWTDHHCETLKNARELRSMGQVKASVAVLCTIAENRYALAVTGVQCPMSQDEWERAGRPTLNAQGLAQTHEGNLGLIVLNDAPIAAALPQPVATPQSKQEDIEARLAQVRRDQEQLALAIEVQLRALRIAQSEARKSN